MGSILLSQTELDTIVMAYIPICHEKTYPVGRLRGNKIKGTIVYSQPTCLTYGSGRNLQFSQDAKYAGAGNTVFPPDTFTRVAGEVVSRNSVLFSRRQSPSLPKWHTTATQSFTDCFVTASILPCQREGRSSSGVLGRDLNFHRGGQFLWHHDVTLLWCCLEFESAAGWQGPSSSVIGLAA